MTNPERQRIEDLFEEALEHPAPERESWLASACPDEPGLRKEVLELLAAHGRGRGILETDPSTGRPADAGRYRSLSGGD
jgi:hypothetical protein